MIVRRNWTSDLYAFYCADEMDKLGIRIVAIVYKPNGYWEVWGQSEKPIDFNLLDRNINKRLDPSEDE